MEHIIAGGSRSVSITKPSTVENKLVPIGVVCVRGNEHSALRDGSNTPTVEGASNKSTASIKSPVIYC